MRKPPITRSRAGRLGCLCSSASSPGLHQREPYAVSLCVLRSGLGAMCAGLGSCRKGHNIGVDGQGRIRYRRASHKPSTSARLCSSCPMPLRGSAFTLHRTVRWHETSHATQLNIENPSNASAELRTAYRSHDFGLTPAHARERKDAGAESDPKKVSDPPSHLSGRESEPEGLSGLRLVCSRPLQGPRAVPTGFGTRTRTRVWGSGRAAMAHRPRGGGGG